VLATVVICTRDRRALLERCLGALAAMVVPAGVPWEVLVVDNGSSDGTRELAESFTGSLPIRVVDEGRPGVSSARNRGVTEARGSYLLWLDDDALVAPGWLSAYCEAIARFPGDAIFGGPIELEFTSPLPDWFARVLPRVSPIFGARDLGDSHVTLAARESGIPFGANFATRVQEQRHYIFDPDLGRHPRHPGRGSEETEVMMAMLGDGHSGHWVPGARVRHLKGTDRINLAFMSDHIADYGEYRARRETPGGLWIGGAPLGAWTRLWRGKARYAIGRRILPVERWIDQFIEMSEARGWLAGHRKRSSAKPR
jgi:glycosyltransferase involved in cell wall biosynthesis